MELLKNLFLIQLMYSKKLTKIDKKLSENKFIISEHITIVDIAWFVYLRRLETVGFSFKKNYPNVNKWFEELKKNKNFLKETFANPLENYFFYLQNLS